MENSSTNLRGGKHKYRLRKRETRLLCVSTCMSDLKLILQIPLTVTADIVFQRPLPPVLTDDGTSLTVVARYP